MSGNDGNRFRTVSVGQSLAQAVYVDLRGYDRVILSNLSSGIVYLFEPGTEVAAGDVSFPGDFFCLGDSRYAQAVVDVAAQDGVFLVSATGTNLVSVWRYNV